MTFVVGVTGGIGSGKTTVANMFAEQFSIPVVDTDVIARQVVEPNTQGLNAIIERFGDDILTAEGMLDRAKLRQIIFSDPAQKTWLNQLLHPLIRQQTQQALEQSKAPYTLCVIPLLVENNLQFMVDRILVVDVSEQIQIERTCARDQVALEQAQSILNAQASREQRLACADDVIDNSNNDKAGLLTQIERLHNLYLTASLKSQPQ